MKCPACPAQITKPAKQGGVLVRNAYLRIEGERVIVACPQCKTEQEIDLQRRKLVLLVRKPSAKSSSSSSANEPPTN